MSGDRSMFFCEPDVARFLGVIAALSSEVFVLKAQVARLTNALKANGALSEAQLESAGASPELERWLADEEKAFGRAILRPFAHPDEAPDVSHLMTER